MFCREEFYRTSAPVPLKGAPDLVMQRSDGVLVVVDIKTRARPVAYASDIMQMSVYCVLLMRCTGRPVAEYGYALVQSCGESKYIRANLLGEAAIVSLYHRYVAVRDGFFMSAKANSRPLCLSCAYATECGPQI